ncbi:type IV toxin-antitoxin system AbiEi family antitoxin [Photobacterium sp. 2_MG-2023]|uniref:type IV toxin-antitoxin system AbiEi family antitoxin n=1 Tax=Photobacterium sp. 2_MG-2023 TaxID=3062663 RepID=UPI0026E2DBDB|nr:type IV toxin-antitoxin system AbiEi family antitoxin [Photobacterium sp. 2_MG-2023]MDO6581190.1 type IV toxin-antitoxin system AbiEi family antitoxin [Photobacterium sp. 2_MG-2023]
MKSVEITIDQILKRLPESWEPQYTAYSYDDIDGTLTLKFGDNTRYFPVKIKQVHRKESLYTYSEQSAQTGMLITNTLSQFLKGECDKLGINYIDGSGSVRIVQDNLYVLIERLGNKAEVSTHSNTMSIGIVKCVFALYSEPNLLYATYQEIALKAGVSLGMVNKAIQYLINNRYMPQAKKSRRLLDVDQLLYEWLISYRKTIIPKRVTIPYPPPSSWNEITLKDSQLWGGEVAALQLTEYLNPQELLLYSSEAMQRYPLGTKDSPMLYVTKPFWGNELEISEKGHALLTIGDLLASHDGRNREVAELINERYLRIKVLPQ